MTMTLLRKRSVKMTGKHTLQACLLAAALFSLPALAANNDEENIGQSAAATI